MYIFIYYNPILWVIIIVFTYTIEEPRVGIIHEHNWLHNLYTKKNYNSLIFIYTKCLDKFIVVFKYYYNYYVTIINMIFF